jgi:hypothetical protein
MSIYSLKAAAIVWQSYLAELGVMRFEVRSIKVPGIQAVQRKTQLALACESKLLRMNRLRLTLFRTFQLWILSSRSKARAILTRNDESFHHLSALGA